LWIFRPCCNSILSLNHHYRTGIRKAKFRRGLSRFTQEEAPVVVDKDYIRKSKAAFCIQRLFFAEKARRYASRHLLFRTGFMNDFDVMIKLKKKVRFNL
jgi:hypothetical protein